MPGKDKPGGGLESSAVYKMKNPVLRSGAKGEPIQKNFAKSLLGPAGMLFKKPVSTKDLGEDVTDNPKYSRQKKEGKKVYKSKTGQIRTTQNV